LQDISDLNEILSRFPDSYGSRADRLAGHSARTDSGYYHIARFFGENSINPSDITLEIVPGTYRIPDPLIQQYAAEVADDLRSQGRLYDGPGVTGLLTDAPSNENRRLRLQKTGYADFAGTCFALDRPHELFAEDGGTLRAYYLDRYGHLAPAERPLANCIGVCGYLLLEDNGCAYILQVTRAGKLATLADTLGPTVAGSVDFNPAYKTLSELAVGHLGAEIEEELALSAAEYRVRPLAFAREIMRGDNPQVFCLIETALSLSDITVRLESIPQVKREFSSYRFLSMDDQDTLPKETVETLNFEARMSYLLMEEYRAWLAR
jgi:hypothetical protein